MSAIPIYVGSKVVGSVLNDTFRKTIHEKHVLQRPRALAFDDSTLRAAKAAGARIVEVTNLDTKITYRAPIDRLYDLGFKVERGYGKQIAMLLDESLGYWEVTFPPKKASPVQLLLL